MSKALYGTVATGTSIVLELGPVALKTTYHYNMLEERWDIHTELLKPGTRIQWDSMPQIMETEYAHEQAASEAQKEADLQKDRFLNPPLIELGPIESEESFKDKD